MVCTKCGLDIDTGAVFCGNCGQPVQNMTGATPVPAAQASTEAVAGAVTAAQPLPVAAAAPIAPAVQAAEPLPVAPAAPQAFPAPQPAPVFQAAPVAAPVQPAVAAPGVPAYGLPVQASGPGGGKAIAAMVLGIIGLVASLIPILGFIFGGLALMFGKQSKQSSHPSMSKAGSVLGSIAIALSGIVFSYNLSTMDKTATFVSALLR
jgi:hypothetical protein